MQNFIRCVFGRKGAGKTHYIKYNIIPSVNKKTVICDSLKEYQGVYCSNFQELAKCVLLPVQVLTYFPEDDEDFYALCTFIYHTYNTHFIIDEIALWVSTHSAPEPLMFLFRTARHRQIDITIASQRPADVPRLFTSLADEIIIFQTVENRDVEYLCKYTNLSPEEVVNLPVHKPLIINRKSQPVQKSEDIQD